MQQKYIEMGYNANPKKYVPDSDPSKEYDSYPEMLANHPEVAGEGLPYHVRNG